MDGETTEAAGGIAWLTLFFAWFLVGLAVGIGLRLAEAIFKIDLRSAKVFQKIIPGKKEKPAQEQQPVQQVQHSNGSTQWPQAS